MEKKDGLRMKQPNGCSTRLCLHIHQRWCLSRRRKTGRNSALSPEHHSLFPCPPVIWISVVYRNRYAPLSLSRFATNPSRYRGKKHVLPLVYLSPAARCSVRRKKAASCDRQHAVSQQQGDKATRYTRCSVLQTFWRLSSGRLHYPNCFFRGV